MPGQPGFGQIRIREGDVPTLSPEEVFQSRFLVPVWGEEKFFSYVSSNRA